MRSTTIALGVWLVTGFNLAMINSVQKTVAIAKPNMNPPIPLFVRSNLELCPDRIVFVCLGRTAAQVTPTRRTMLVDQAQFEPVPAEQRPQSGVYRRLDPPHL